MFDLKCSLRKNVFYYIISVSRILVYSANIKSNSHEPNSIKPSLDYSSNISQISDVNNHNHSYSNTNETKINPLGVEAKSDQPSIESTLHVPDIVKPILDRTNISHIADILNKSHINVNGSRRILLGSEANFDRPYLVYLRLPKTSARFQSYRIWLCAGVIVDSEYIITSAACIEDARHFYVIAGTNKFDPDDDKHSSLCFKNGARKAIWKCVPKNYMFDKHEEDNIRWMSNDIALVKVDEEWNFNQRVRGCDYIPKCLSYNNKSADLEKPGNIVTIAGWGSTDKYSEWLGTRRNLPYSTTLLETTVEIITKSRCKVFWGARFEYIIDNFMICSSDLSAHMSETCDERYVDCVPMEYSEESAGLVIKRRKGINRKQLRLFSYHNYSDVRRSARNNQGGFCENDHGGPMVHGEGPTTVVIGIISACLVKERSNKCQGPFLYTSVYKNRKLLDCAMFKDVQPDCSKLFRSHDDVEEIHMSWIDHPDGPAKNEIGPQVKSQYKKVFSTEPSNIHVTSTTPTVKETNEMTLTPEEQSDKKSAVLTETPIDYDY